MSMNKNKNFLLFGLTIFYLIVCAGCKHDVQIYTQNISEPGLTAKIQVPLLPDYPELENQIKQAVNKDFENYRKYAQMEYSFNEESVHTYRTELETKETGRYLNLIIRKYLYAGPEVEDEYFITFTYDKRQKRTVTLPELTKKTLQEISNLCYDSFVIRIEDFEKLSKGNQKYVLDEIKKGTSPQLENFSSFAVDGKYIYLYFSSGSVLSNYYGSQIIRIKR